MRTIDGRVEVHVLEVMEHMNAANNLIRNDTSTSKNDKEPINELEVRGPNKDSAGNTHCIDWNCFSFPTTD